jgi:CheY-like chemotaxis protein
VSAPATEIAGAPRVLLVDDIAENRLALRATLESLPCELIEVASGEEALRHLLREDVAVLVLDVQMPGLDGYATARHIRARPKTRHVPLIFISGIDRDLEHQLRGYDCGAIDFLAKPFEPATLLAKVGRLLELDTSRRHLEQESADAARQLAMLEDRYATLERRAAGLVTENTRLRGSVERGARCLLDPAELAAGYLALARDACARDASADAQGLVARAEEAARRLAEEVGRMSAHALSSERTPLAPVDTAALLAQVRERVGPLLGHVRLTTDPLPIVRSDHFLLGTVFTELVLHCVAGGGQAPRLHVGVTRRRQEWVLTFSANRVPDEAPPDAVGDLVLNSCARIIARLDGSLWTGERSGEVLDVSIVLPAGDPGHGAPASENGALGTPQVPDGR